MLSSRDSHIIELWLQRQASPHTRGCYRRDAARLLAHVSKPLSRIAFGDLQSFAQALVEVGLAPISRARTLAAVKSPFGFCHAQRPPRQRLRASRKAAKWNLSTAPAYDSGRMGRDTDPWAL
jgi:site-specific recombinase XerD